jgi:hypothetical protein
MLKAKDGDFFISDWLRNRNTVEFLGIWETVHNPGFNCGEFATIKSQAGLNNYKISVKEWVEKTNAIGLKVCGFRFPWPVKLPWPVESAAAREVFALLLHRAACQHFSVSAFDYVISLAREMASLFTQSHKKLCHQMDNS